MQGGFISTLLTAKTSGLRIKEEKHKNEEKKNWIINQKPILLKISEKIIQNIVINHDFDNF